MAILDFIRGYAAREGCTPTVREIQTAVGGSLSTVDYHIGRLESAGELKRSTKASPRNITVTGKEGEAERGGWL